MIIALLTDFGTQDSYVGVMKGVIAGIAPEAQVIDLTHEIRPQDVAHGAYTLMIAVPYFPAGTIFCAVVDPGVGSARRAVAVKAGEWIFVLPDNGMLTHILDRWPVHGATTLANPRYQLSHPSATFHGRDIFAPAAAYLAAGVPLASLGEPLPSEALRRLDLPTARRMGDHVIGTVMHIDRFGNLVTNISRQHLAEIAVDDPGSREGDGRVWQVELEGTEIVLSPIASTFSDVPPGAPVAYIGSDGFLELAVRNGNAADRWNVGLGIEVRATQLEKQNKD